MEGRCIKVAVWVTEEGKPKILIIGATMRKLVHIIYGVLKNNPPFNSNIIAKNA